MTYANIYKIGDRIRFAEERQYYTVRAWSPNWLICTRSFKLRDTVLYSIVSFEQQIRGPGDKIFNGPYETDDQITDRMHEIMSGRLKVSRRHGIPLVIVP